MYTLLHSASVTVLGDYRSPRASAAAAAAVPSADRVKAAGVSYVVVGEAFLREEDPAKAAQSFLL